MKAGARSLLRRLSTASGSILLLGLASLVLSAPARAAAPGPDPSPSGGSVQPDPFPASPRPQAPAHFFVPSSRAPAETTPAARPKHKTRPVVTPASTPIRARRPDNPAPGTAEGLVSVADPGRHVSTGLALAVAALVLLSGALVAGAAREVAR